MVARFSCQVGQISSFRIIYTAANTKLTAIFSLEARMGPFMLDLWAHALPLTKKSPLHPPPTKINPFQYQYLHLTQFLSR